jgi:hypothetical protein
MISGSLGHQTCAPPDKPLEPRTPCDTRAFSPISRSRPTFMPGEPAICITVDAIDELAVAFKPIELEAHRRSEVLPALPGRSRPHPLQHLHRVVGILRRPPLPLRHRDLPATPRRALRGDGAPAPGVIPRPPGHPHDLIKDPALIPLRSLHIRLRVPRRDLGSRIHRQLVFHAQQCSPLRGHSYVRHGQTFAGTFAESRRELHPSVS